MTLDSAGDCKNITGKSFSALKEHFFYQLTIDYLRYTHLDQDYGIYIVPIQTEVSSVSLRNSRLFLELAGHH